MFGRGRERRRRRNGGPDCGDCGDCVDCPLLLLTPWLLLTRVLPGAFSITAIDPYSRANGPVARLLSRLIRSYQVNVSAVRSQAVCRMTPSCSRYGLTAISRHGALRGSWLTVKRLRRCGLGAAREDLVPAGTRG